LRKIILYILSNAIVETKPSENYLELLQYSSGKASLLLFTLARAKAK